MKPRLISKSVFVPSPEAGTHVSGGTYYTKSEGLSLMSLHSYSSRSDIMSHEYYRFSDDNGRSWSEPDLVMASRKTTEGTLQRHVRGGYLDPGTNKFLKIRNEAVLPNDEVSEFMQFNTVHYSVSVDGGKSDLYDVPLIADGDGYNSDHPLPNVTRGKNSFMLGDRTCRPITLPDGTILLPVQISPVGPDGSYYNPRNAFTYTDCAVIRGRWREDLTIAWNLGGMVTADPERTTRGLIEPTIARLGDGRILMVMRGSNDVDHALPGYRWWSISDDEGETFSKAAPWHYSSGDAFFSPSACSQLVSHSNGEIYWIGNICDSNSEGNAPRYPIVIGRVDQDAVALVNESVLIIDDRSPGDGEFLTMSNFYAREDRETRSIKLHMLRLSRGDNVFEGDCMLYDIAVE